MYISSIISKLLQRSSREVFVHGHQEPAGKEGDKTFAEDLSWFWITE
jgi:hypothetical protein